MARVVAALVVVAAVFVAGYVVGRSSTEDRADAAVDPDTAATQPGSQADPVAPGTAFVVGPWTVTVDDFDPEATEAVLAANQFNVEPPAGRTHVTVEVTITRRGDGPGVVRGSLAPSLDTPSGASYPLTAECGVISDPLDPQRLLAQGESVSGAWCWVLPSVELDKVALRVAGTGGGEVWFALP